MKTGIIIVAGGSGTRMGANVPKQFLKLCGRTILVRTVETFRRALPDSEIVVVLSRDMMDFWKQIVSDENCQAEHIVCEGGAQRFDSVGQGLEHLSSDVEIIGVHDGVRPLVGDALIVRCLDVAKKFNSAVPVVALVDSVREVQSLPQDDVIAPKIEQSRPLDRSRLRAVQTPQMFSAELLRTAYQCPFQPVFTDDASVVEAMTGRSVVLCDGDVENIKITNPIDLKIAELILQTEQKG